MARREPHWVKLFLRELERTGNVRIAAERAGVDFSTAYQRRKRHGEFAERWALRLAAFRDGSGQAGALRLRSGQALEEEQALPSADIPAALARCRSLEVGSAPLSSAESPSPSRGEGIVVRPDGKLVKGSDARWGKRAEEGFLVELTVSASVRRAARAAGFSTTAVYKRRMKDRRFAAAWDAALETGKARVQAYLVEAATRTFDSDELPIGDDGEMDRVSISEAINIAKLPARDGGGAAGGFAKGGRGFEGRTYDETGFDTTPITRDEWEEAGRNIVDRLARLREQMEDEERKTGRCQSCGQMLPELGAEAGAE